MDSFIIYFCCFIGGSFITIVALALVRGGANREVPEIDPEKEEAIKEWEEQSKGY